ncbi:MAG: dehydrogenase (ubiquinone) 24 kDa subunit [Nitrospirae bacterium]|nr:dehydrogenase (ubiquinone) 24 kDa subunit [Nitrospirota bacterium]
MADNGKILVVDDEPIVLRSCERILKSEGYSIALATSGQEAINILQKDDYDLVITDLKMPEVDGIALIKWLRNSKPATGVVVITGYPSQETIKDALNLGIIDYLPKPFTPLVLIDVTAKAMKMTMVRALPEKTPEEADVESKTAALEKIIAENRNRPGSLIPVLQQAQGLIGYLPPSVQRHIAKGLNIPVSEVHGVVSFYSFFTMKPKGKHSVKVCLGTACYVKRAEEIIEKLKATLNIDVGEVTKDRKFSLESVRCLGACGLAPVVVIDHTTHASVDPVKTPEILKQYE